MLALVCILKIIHILNKTKVNCSNATLTRIKNINKMHNRIHCILYTWSELHKVKCTFTNNGGRKKQQEIVILSSA